MSYNLRPKCCCNPTFDVRCTCYINDVTWERCPERARTAYFMITNDCDTYMMINDKGIHQLKKNLMKKYKLSTNDWENIIIYFEEDY